MQCGFLLALLSSHAWAMDPDDDMDGFPLSVDCNDGDDTVFPGAVELCDGQDNDCDLALPAVEADVDADQYVACTIDPQGWNGDPSVVGGDDCNDTIATIHPTAADVCGNGLDDDCDGEGDHGPNAGLPGGFTDDDGDGILFSDELVLGIDDCDVDSDQDGLNDDVELALGTRPDLADTDLDTLDDGVENDLGTDPLLADTDGDSIPDATEIQDPLSPTDTDGDDLLDALDVDDDNDGVLSLDEATGDLDSDGLVDYLDDDDDGDGIPTALEMSQGSNHRSLDSDGDGALDGDEWINWLRDSPDVDCLNRPGDCDDVDGGSSGSGLDDPWDRDADGLINPIDDDDDGDTLQSVFEGQGHFECQTTAPGDGIPNFLDYDSDDDGILDADEANGDADGDTLPDRLDCEDDGCQGDSDLDGIPNCVETDILAAIPDLPSRFDNISPQNNPDIDGDLIPDGLEVGDLGCLTFGEPCTPRNTDLTRESGSALIPVEPDIVDIDDDGDGWTTTTEVGLCPGFEDPELVYDGTWVLQCPDGSLHLPVNTDADQGTWFPFEPDDIPDYLDDDDDGDGIPTLQDGAGDDDGDGVFNWVDPVDYDGPIADPDLDGLTNETETALGTEPYDDDSDSDGIIDPIELGDPSMPSDFDGDGLINPIDPDDDADGLATAAEGTQDFDQDGIPNHLDDDSDDDGVLDGSGEGFDDVDCDGAPDVHDPVDDDGPCARTGPFLKPPDYDGVPCGCGYAKGSGPLMWVLLGLWAFRRHRRRDKLIAQPR